MRIFVSAVILAITFGNSACASAADRANPPATAPPPALEANPAKPPAPTPTDDPSIFKPPPTGDAEIVTPPPQSGAKTPVIKPPENPPPNPAPSPSPDKVKPRTISGPAGG
jgi:hypothetical protein